MHILTHTLLVEEEGEQPALGEVPRQNLPQPTVQHQYVHPQLQHLERGGEARMRESSLPFLALPSPSPASHPPQEQVEGPFPVSLPPQLPASFQSLPVATHLQLFCPKTAHRLQPTDCLPHHLPSLGHCILDLLQQCLEKWDGVGSEKGRLSTGQQILVLCQSSSPCSF